MNEEKDLMDTIQAILDEPDEDLSDDLSIEPDEALTEGIDEIIEDDEAPIEEIDEIIEDDEAPAEETAEAANADETEEASEQAQDLSEKEHDLMHLVARVIAKGITRRELEEDGEVLFTGSAEELGLETAEEELEESEAKLKAEKSEKAKAAEKPEESEEAKAAKKPEESEEAVAAEKSEEEQKSEVEEKSEEAETSEKSEEMEKSEKTEDLEKSEKAKEKKPKVPLRERLKKFHRFKTKKALCIAIVCEILLVAGTCGIIVSTIHTKEFQERQRFISAQIAVEFLETLPGRVHDVAEQVYDSARDAFRTYLRNRLIKRAANLEFIAPEHNGNVSGTDTYQIVSSAYSWGGQRLSRSAGAVTGPNGRETYYNLNMSVIVSMMQSRGTPGGYWVRSDGVKMYGNYVMCAANLSVHPRGSIVKSSVGLAIVCDTGGFAASNPNQLDIATTW